MNDLTSIPDLLFSPKAVEKVLERMGFRYRRPDEIDVGDGIGRHRRGGLSGRSRKSHSTILLMKPRHVKSVHRTGITKANIHDAAQQHRLWMELAESHREKAREHERDAQRDPMYKNLSQNRADSERRLAKSCADNARFRRTLAGWVRNAPYAQDQKPSAGTRKTKSADKGGR